MRRNTRGISNFRNGRGFADLNLPRRQGSTLGNWNLPNRRTTLGDVGPDPYIGLTAADIAAFLDRHPREAAIVRAFETQVSTWGYREADRYPIPRFGMAVPDSVFRNVVIFPDVEGTLRFSGNVSDTVAEQINKPAYESPAGEQPLDKLLAAVPWIIGGYVALQLLGLWRKS